MKRAVMLLAAGAVIFGSALAATAQAPTVSFGGQMRVFGFVSDNITDFRDSKNGDFRDNNSFYFQRFRLFTTIESADKKAKAYWAAEIGDITWGTGGGATGGEWRGCSAAGGTTATPAVGRTGQSTGGCLGADAVNVETKNLYLWFDTSDLVPGTNFTLGIQDVLFLNTPVGAFFEDDAAAISFNWKAAPVDVQLWTSKFGEGSISNADDTDAYAARLGVDLTKDLRVTLEGLVIDERALPRQNIGDSLWIGATVAAKVADIQLSGAFVYGRRALGRDPSTGPGDPFQEEGWGAIATAQIPVGPVNVWAVGWYTSGDDRRGPCGATPPASPTGVASCNSTGPVTRDSDKLPLAEGQGSWISGGAPWIGEGLFGLQTIGGPGPAANTAANYEEVTGTWGLGGSATYALTPAVSIGGGVAYVNATDASDPRWGDNLIEFDAGLIYRFNPNLSITGIFTYLVPDTGDNAYLLGFRTQFSF